MQALHRPDDGYSRRFKEERGVKILGGNHWTCLAVWIVCASQFAAQEGPLPAAHARSPELVTGPEEGSAILSQAQRRTEDAMAAAAVPFARRSAWLSMRGVAFDSTGPILVGTMFVVGDTRKVLTLEYLSGIKITDFDEMDRQGVDRKEAGRILAEAYAQMFFSDGLFHGDPHPGNIFVRPGPEVILVDFGMVDRLTVPKREGLRRAFAAIIDRDSLGLVRSLVDMGFMPLTQDIKPLVHFVERMFVKYRDMSASEFKAMDIEEIGRDITEALQLTPSIQIPNDFILFGRVIGMLNGVAAGAGCSLALACDMRLMSSKAKLIEVFIRIGLVPDSGSHWFLAHLVGMAKAFEYATTGRDIGAEEAERVGLVNKIVSPDKLEEETMALATQFAQAPTKAIGLIKRALNKSLASDLDTILDYEAYIQQIASETDDHREGIKAFLDKRPAIFSGK